MTSLVITSSNALKSPGPALRRPERIPAGARGVAVVHDDDHGNGLLLRDQVIEDQVGVALEDPSGLVFARAVLEIENRIARQWSWSRNQEACRRSSAAIGR